MYVKGTKTTVDSIKVKIDPLDALYRITQSLLPFNHDHFIMQGAWYHDEGYGYSTKKREATEDEIKLYNAIQLIQKTFKAKNKKKELGNL